jgi:lipopolysaccharide assembly outer membrane protein LptD (OstA)
MPDSAGNLQGNPAFKKGKETFDAHWMRYNFKTQKGFIYFVKTKQQDGTLIGDSTKRNVNGQVHIHGGTYSTCDLDHPHFYIGLTKAKSIPGDKIVSGPAYLVVADIPLPIVIPFGFFPNTNKNSSGILIPTWGEEPNRGFFLSNGGYYLAINDYIDANVIGSAYSKGSWGAKLTTNYRERYKMSGTFSFDYEEYVNDEKGMPDYFTKTDYKVTWNHTQDRKANPSQTFSALVDLDHQVMTNAIVTM